MIDQLNTFRNWSRRPDFGVFCERVLLQPAAVQESVFSSIPSNDWFADVDSTCFERILRESSVAPSTKSRLFGMFSSVHPPRLEWLQGLECNSALSETMTWLIGRRAISEVPSAARSLDRLTRDRALTKRAVATRSIIGGVTQLIASRQQGLLDLFGNAMASGHPSAKEAATTLLVLSAIGTAPRTAAHFLEEGRHFPALSLKALRRDCDAKLRQACFEVFPSSASYAEKLGGRLSPLQMSKVLLLRDTLSKPEARDFQTAVTAWLAGEQSWASLRSKGKSIYSAIPQEDRAARWLKSHTSQQKGLFVTDSASLPALVDVSFSAPVADRGRSFFDNLLDPTIRAFQAHSPGGWLEGLGVARIHKRRGISEVNLELTESSELGTRGILSGLRNKANDCSLPLSLGR